MWKQTCGKVCLGYKKLELSRPLCSGVAWGKTGNSRPNNIRKQLHLIKSSCIKCRHLHLRYFLRSTGLIQLQLKWKSKLKIKSLSSPVTAKTFKIRWNNSMLCVSKKPVIQHQPQSPPIRHPSVIFETSVTEFSTLSGNTYLLHLPGGAINLLLYLLFWHICSTSHSVFKQTAGEKHFCMHISGNLGCEQYLCCITLQVPDFAHLELSCTFCLSALSPLFLHDCFLSQIQD